MARKAKVSDEVPSGALPPAGLLDVEGAARWFGISRTKLFELMHEADFPVIVITARVIRFDPHSLYEWVLKRQKTRRWVA